MLRTTPRARGRQRHVDPRDAADVRRDRARAAGTSTACSPAATAAAARRARPTPTTSPCPSGEHDLDVGVALASEPRRGRSCPATSSSGCLEDPSGDVVAYDTNFTVSSQQGRSPRASSTCTRPTPSPATWQLVLDWVQPGDRRRAPRSRSRARSSSTRSRRSSDLPDAASTDVSRGRRDVHRARAQHRRRPHGRCRPTRGSRRRRRSRSRRRRGAPSTQTAPGASNTYYVPDRDELARPSTRPRRCRRHLRRLVRAGRPRPLAARRRRPTSPSPRHRRATRSPTRPRAAVSAGLWNVTQDELGPYPASGEPHGDRDDDGRRPRPRPSTRRSPRRCPTRSSR